MNTPRPEDLEFAQCGQNFVGTPAGYRLENAHGPQLRIAYSIGFSMFKAERQTASVPHHAPALAQRGPGLVVQAG